jgi:hypothetical protein
MYLILLALVLNFIGLQASDNYAYNTTNNPVVLYSYWRQTSGSYDTDATVVKPKEKTKLNKFGNRIIEVNKGLWPNYQDRSYKKTDIFKGSSDRTIIVESDPTNRSGLKLRAITEEEFNKEFMKAEKENKAAAAAAPDVILDQQLPSYEEAIKVDEPKVGASAAGGAPFPVQEEVKASAALKPEELAG